MSLTEGLIRSAYNLNDYDVRHSPTAAGGGTKNAQIAPDVSPNMNLP
jgi:hypothetical protein